MSLIKNVAKTSVYSLYKKRQAARIKKAGLALIREYLDNYKMRKLHIGCGGSTLEGWLNADLEAVENKIAYMDAGTDYPLPDGSIDYVFSEHLFEHLNLDQQLKMLSEVLRVLKPGGKARIATPNLDSILNVRDRSDELVQEYLGWSAEVFYPQHLERLGNEVKDPVFLINNYFYSWGHQFIHNPKSFTLLSRKTGFEKITQVSLHQSADPVLRDLETHGNHIPAKFNELETMIFELEK